MDRIERALASLVLAVNGGPCEVHRHAEGGAEGDKRFLIDEMEAATTDLEDFPALRNGMFMLLSLILDLWRRHEYMFTGVAAHLPDVAFDKVNPTYAARIGLHSLGLFSFERALQDHKTDWKLRAEMANDIVHRMLEFTEQRHSDLLGGVMNKVNVEAILDQETHKVANLAERVRAARGGGGSGGPHHPA